MRCRRLPWVYRRREASVAIFMVGFINFMLIGLLVRETDISHITPDRSMNQTFRIFFRGIVGTVTGKITGVKPSCYAVIPFGRQHAHYRLRHILWRWRINYSLEREVFMFRRLPSPKVRNSRRISGGRGQQDDQTLWRADRRGRRE